MLDYNQHKKLDSRFQTSGGQVNKDSKIVKETAADGKFKELDKKYKSDWIKCGADESINEWAKDAGLFMAEKDLTSSKIRNIYGEIKRIQMGGFDKEKSSFYLLKPKVAYAYARADKNKNEGIKLFKKLYDRISTDVDSTEKYQNFCSLIEAVLAYHKAAMVELGKKDN